MFGLAGCIKNKLNGLAREKRAKDILERRYGKENILNERTLRGADGKKAIDPLTQEGRRVDFVVKGKDGVWRPIEITSMTNKGNKANQIAKEVGIQAELAKKGSDVFVRHPKTRELIPIQGTSKVIGVR
ncbi:hypothetical protein [Pasteurella sp. WM03]|uniref:hypothetical protein n=1 Tax=Pasteurella sp. WM03 TaxID=2558280 RepID=UPI001FD743E3